MSTLHPGLVRLPTKLWRSQQPEYSSSLCPSQTKRRSPRQSGQPRAQDLNRSFSPQLVQDSNPRDSQGVLSHDHSSKKRTKKVAPGPNHDQAGACCPIATNEVNPQLPTQPLPHEKQASSLIFASIAEDVIPLNCNQQQVCHSLCAIDPSKRGALDAFSSARNLPDAVSWTLQTISVCPFVYSEARFTSFRTRG